MLEICCDLQQSVAFLQRDRKFSIAVMLQCTAILQQPLSSLNEALPGAQGSCRSFSCSRIFNRNNNFRNKSGRFEFCSEKISVDEVQQKVFSQIEIAKIIIRSMGFKISPGGILAPIPKFTRKNDAIGFHCCLSLRI